jgi:hypothetical protein
MTIANDPNLGTSTLTGTLTQAVSAGVATFSDLKVTAVVPASGFTLGAAGGALTATSNSFNITL